MILAKFHDVSSLLSVLKIAIFDAKSARSTPIENELDLKMKIW